MYTAAFGKTALNAQLHCDTWKFAPTKKVNLSLFMITCVEWRPMAVDELTTYDEEDIDVFLWAFPLSLAPIALAFLLTYFDLPARLHCLRYSNRAAHFGIPCNLFTQWKRPTLQTNCT